MQQLFWMLPWWPRTFLQTIFHRICCIHVSSEGSRDLANNIPLPTTKVKVGIRKTPCQHQKMMPLAPKKRASWKLIPGQLKRDRQKGVLFDLQIGISTTILDDPQLSRGHVDGSAYSDTSKPRLMKTAISFLWDNALFLWGIWKQAKCSTQRTSREYESLSWRCSGVYYWDSAMFQNWPPRS